MIFPEAAPASSNSLISMRCGRTCGGPGIPYRRIPQALARPEVPLGVDHHVPRGPARRRRRNLSRLHHGYRGQRSRRRKSLSRTSSLSASASTTNATGPSWSRRTPSSSSGTSKPIPVLRRRSAPVSPGTTTTRDLMHVWREDLVIHPDNLPCSPLFSRIRAPSAIPEMTARFRKRDGVYISFRRRPSPACATTRAIPSAISARSTTSTARPVPCSRSSTGPSSIS